VTERVSATGTITNSYHYDPWGTCMAAVAGAGFALASAPASVTASAILLIVFGVSVVVLGVEAIRPFLDRWFHIEQ
jgi:hypothetical protein